MKYKAESDLFLEDNYNIQKSLNTFKKEIIRQMGENILEIINNINIKLSKPVDIYSSKAKRDFDNIYNDYNNQSNNDIYDEKSKQINCKKQIRDNELILIFDNLPIIINIYNNINYEYGNKYNAGILNLINEDEEINSYRKTINIFSENFYKICFRWMETS